MRLVMLQAEDTFKKEKFVLSVAQSPDGRWLASGSMDGTVAVFDAATGQLLHTLEGHFKSVRALCFTPGATHARPPQLRETSPSLSLLPWAECVLRSQQASPQRSVVVITVMLLLMTDSKMLVTACDDMLSHLYDVEHGSLIDAFSGAGIGLLHAAAAFRSCTAAGFLQQSWELDVGQ